MIGSAARLAGFLIQLISLSACNLVGSVSQIELSVRHDKQASLMGR